MTVYCGMCGKVMQRKPSQVKKHKTSFCSKACHNNFLRKGSEVPCAWYGKYIYKPPSQQTYRNFCCQTCRLKWLGQNNIEHLNIPGHSAGHKAPHLSRMNRLRNPKGSLHCNKSYVASSSYRRIVETAIGRKLKSFEVVHHINGDRTDNRLENLQVMSKHEHDRLHMEIAMERFKKEYGVM